MVQLYTLSNYFVYCTDFFLFLKHSPLNSESVAEISIEQRFLPVVRLRCTVTFFPFAFGISVETAHLQVANRLKKKNTDCCNNVILPVKKYILRTLV